MLFLNSGKTLVEHSLLSVCHIAGKFTQSYDFTLPSTCNSIVFSFVALLRNKDELTIGLSYSLGSSTQKRFDWLEQVAIVNRPANTAAAVAKTRQSKKLETFLRELYFNKGCQIPVITRSQ